MENFKFYAEYYDLIYQSKDYLKETEFIIKTFKERFGTKPKNVLDIGCGTGKHIDLITRKLDIQGVGIDISERMITTASEAHSQNQRVDFLIGDATNFKLKNSFDLITSLFHVLSYQTTNEQVVSFFANAYNHMNEGALLLVDFWFGSAVLNLRPESRLHKFENSELKVLKYAKPNIDHEKNIVEVTFDMIVFDKRDNNQIYEFKEVHNMRYFFIPELIYLARQAGFEIVAKEEWLSGHPLGEDSWNGFMIFKK